MAEYQWLDYHLEMDAQEYAMSGLETHHQQEAAAAAEDAAINPYGCNADMGGKCPSGEPCKKHRCDAGYCKCWRMRR